MDYIYNIVVTRQYSRGKYHSTYIYAIGKPRETKHTLSPVSN